jgi:hypothetical protein
MEKLETGETQGGKLGGTFLALHKRKVSIEEDIWGTLSGIFMVNKALKLP